MEIKFLENAKDRYKFLWFKKKIYKGDKNYVGTDNFLLRDFLKNRISVAKSSDTVPFMICENGKIFVEGMFIYNPRFSALQIGFFEALPDSYQAVSFMLDEAKKIAFKLKIKRIIIGMNGHISCPSGIMIDGFDRRPCINTLYNKDYYQSYFSSLPSYTMSTYSSKIYDLRSKIGTLKNDNEIKVRKADFSHIDDELETVRIVSEKAFSKTNLHYMTERHHYFELIHSIKHLLKEENLLFAETKGVTVGFLLWFPNFNQIVKSGKDISLFNFNMNCFTKAKKVDTIKISSICSVNSPRATTALLTKLRDVENGRYEYAETSIVLDDNVNMTLLNQKLFDKPNRKYAIYYMEL